MNFNCILNDSEFIHKILRDELPLHERDENGLNLFLYTLTSDKYIQHLELLLKHKKNALYEGFDTALFHAIENENVPGVELLLKHGANPNFVKSYAWKETPILLAIRKRNLYLVKLLLQYGADINEKDGNDTTGLMIAIYQSNMEMVKFLITNGADVNIHSIHGTALKKTLLDRNDGLSDLLIDSGALIVDVHNEMKESALHIAAQVGSLKRVQYFVQSGIPVNQQNRAGQTPVMIACMHRHYDVVEYLIACGAHIKATSSKEVIGILNILNEGNVKLIQLLLKNGLNLNEIIKKENPFYYVTNCESMNFLLEFGLNINERNRFNKNDYAALHFSKTIDQLEILEQHKEKMEPELLEKYLELRFAMLLQTIE
ncbi:hypothetical protein bcgnr5369_08840 [Bacillus cereus]